MGRALRKRHAAAAAAEAMLVKCADGVDRIRGLYSKASTAVDGPVASSGALTLGGIALALRQR